MTKTKFQTFPGCVSSGLSLVTLTLMRLKAADKEKLRRSIKSAHVISLNFPTSENQRLQCLTRSPERQQHTHIKTQHSHWAVTVQIHDRSDSPTLDWSSSDAGVKDQTTETKHSSVVVRIDLQAADQLIQEQSNSQKGQRSESSGPKLIKVTRR